MSDKTQSILLAGVVCGVATAIVSQIPVLGGCLCCMTYMGAGVMGVWHFTNATEQTIMSSGEGAGMGALAGIVAAIAASVLGYAFLALGIGPGIEEALDQLYDSGLEQEQLDMIEGFIRSPLLWVGSVVVSTLFGTMLGAVGGAIGVSIFAKKQP